MKKRNLIYPYFPNLFLAVTLSLIYCIPLHAQVSVTATAGVTGPVVYSNLGAAFTAINAGTHRGNIVADITGNTTEPSSAVLNESGLGSAFYTTVTIRPSGGAARIISGSVAGPLIDLNGADSVLITGLNTGGNTLVIANTNNGTSANTSTIRFINDASRNTVSNCTIGGASSAISTGTIFFSTGLTSGNDQNTINNCTIDSTGGNFPANGIFCSGSTATGVENSSINILSNNISNFFNPILATSGINLSAGGTNWLINGNKLYQSGVCTYTIANVHRAINVGAGNGHVVTGNTVGYSSAAGTGIYTMNGSVASVFVGINLAVGATITTSVQGNSVTAINFTSTLNTANGAGVFSAVNVASGNVNVGNIQGNIIGSASGTNAILVAPGSGGALMGISTASTNTVVILNNMIGGLQCTGISTAVTSAVHGVSISAVAASVTVTNNTIGNNTANNITAGIMGVTTGGTLVSGIFHSAVPLLCNYSNNTIQNLASNGASTSSYVRGIQTTNGTSINSTATINGNTIRNLSTYGTLVGTTNGQVAAQGILLSPGINSVISNNTVYNIAALNATATTNIVAAGISMANASNTTIAGNTIYGISNAGVSTTATTPAVISGILIRSSSVATNVYHNMISLGSGQSTNTAIIGIWLNHAAVPDAADIVVNNTVNITGTVTSGSMPSSCINRGDLTATTRNVPVSIKNNIFTNNRSGGSGKHYAISNNINATGTISGWLAGASNNNVLNSANTATVGYWGGADQDFSNWKMNASSDGNSYSGIAVNYAGTNDLHLVMGTTPTSIESNGLYIPGVTTTDIDGQVRPGPAGSINGGAALPDLGADEFDGVSIDNSPPFITFSNAPNITTVSNRVLTAFVEIKDVTLSTTAGTKPRIYFKKMGDANAFAGNTSADNGWKWVEATNTTSPFSFTIDYSIINGGSVMVSDTIQYFVVAQDLASRITSSPALGFSGSSVATITAAPSIVPYYIIVGLPLSGSFNIGTGLTAPNYSTITEAMNDLSLRGVSGPVTYSIMNGTYNAASGEAFPINISAPAGTSELNTITLMPESGATVTVSESTASTMFRLNGVRFLKIDGRQSGTGTPNSLIIQNNHTSGSAIVFINDASRNILQYITLKGASNTATLGVVNFNTGIVNGNDSNTIDHCDISDAATTPATLIQGLGSIDGTLANYNDYNAITNNNLYNFWHASAESNAFKISNGNNYWTISGNSIYQTVPRTGSASFYTFNLNNGSNYNALNGMMITNNYIGGSAPACGGTPWNQTLTGTGSNWATYFNMGNLDISRFNKNTITNISLTSASTNATGAGVLSCIQYINGMLSADSNTIGSETDSNSIVITAGNGSIFLPVYISASNTAGTYSFSANTFGGIKLNGGGTAGNSIACFTLASANANIIYNIDNNKIGNLLRQNIIALPAASGQNVIGIAVPGTNTAALRIRNNIIRNLANYVTGSGLVYGMNITAGSAPDTVSGNEVYNLTNAGLAHGNDNGSASIIGIQCVPASFGNMISQNKIYGLSQINTGPAIVTINGINVNGATSMLISRNSIHSFSIAASGTAATMNGINVVGGTIRVVNNMIRLGIDTAGNSITTTPVITGIYKKGGNLETYFNSVYIGGTDVGSSAGNSFAYNRLAGGVDTVRNNIFVNTRSNAMAGTGGGHYVIGLANTTSLSMNYNVYYSSGTGDSIGLITTVTSPASQSLLSWKSLSSQDANTSFADPDFVNPAGDKFTLDLHLTPGGTTAAEGSGAAIPIVTDDYDGNSRSALTPVDIGADAGNFIPVDRVAPYISYTPLANTISIGDRLITATITDVSGIYLSGSFQPRIYFKKFVSGSYANSQGVFVSGNKNNSVWSFTISAALLGGVTGTDSIYYYVIAEDSTVSNNTGSNPPGVEANDVYSIINHPALPSSYYIIGGPLSGAYTIGSGLTAPNYATITAAMNDLSLRGVSGPVTYSIMNGTYNTAGGEVFPIDISAPAGVSSLNTITMIPDAGATVTISESTANPIFRLNGVRFLKIDGRQSGTGAPNSLIIQNDNTSGSAVLFINDASRNTLQYITLKGASNTATTGVVNFSTGLVNGNDSNTIDHCDISDAATTPAALIQALGSADGTLARFNDYNIITNNNLYNFWHASAESNALKISNGNNYWIIRGNSIYQTIPRTGSASFYTFNFNNGGNYNALNGMMITNNYVGGSAPACGGAPWIQTFSGTGSNWTTYFNMGNLDMSIFNKNILANINLTSASTNASNAGVLSCIQYVNGMLSADSNTIGSETDSNSIVISAGNGSIFLPVFISASNTPGTYSFSANTFGGIKLNGGGTAGNSIACFTLASANANIIYNIDNNKIGNLLRQNIIALPAASGQNVIGIAVPGTNTAALRIRNNIIRNLANYVTGSGLVYGMNISAGSAPDTVSGNEVYNLTNAGLAHVNDNGSASIIGIQCVPASFGNMISQNKIYGLSQINTGPAVVTINGINVNGATSMLISRNSIHSFSIAASGTAATMNGINVVGGTIRVVNNMIRLGIDTAGNSITTTPVITGIYKKGGNLETYFNSVYIGGTDVGSSAGNSFAYNRLAGGVDTVRNNIFVNTRSNAMAGIGGGHYIIGLANRTDLSMNHNMFYSSGTGDSIGMITTSISPASTTMPGWRSVSGQDASTSFADPGFVNSTGDKFTLDLHLSAGVTTAAEGSGVLVSGVTDDYDGNPRSALTPVDIGADAGNFIPVDLIAPVVSYTSLANTIATGDRTITATITDGSGIYLSGSFQPRIYFKKFASGSYSNNQGVFVSGNKNSSVWSFTISAAALGLVNGADSIYYYIIAQDSTPANNTGSTPPGVDATTVSSVIADPGSPSAYLVTPVISGNFNVGAGEVFTTLTGTDGIFSMINSSVLGGNVTVTLRSDIQEPGTVQLNQITETGTGNYQVRIVPDGSAERVLSGHVNTGMIVLNGADRVIFDGRYAGSGRYIRMIDTSNTGSVISLINDAHRDTIMYCNIQGNNTSTGDVLFGASTSGTGNDSNAVVYCTLGGINRTNLSTNTNISSANSSVGLENSENTIAYNEFINSRYGAINLNPVATGDNWKIYNNEFYLDSVQNPSTSDHRIIQIQGGGGHIIRRNSIGGSGAGRIANPYTISTSGSARNIYAIYYSSTSTFASTIDSNQIGNITYLGVASTGTGIFGIAVTNGTVNVNSNTIGNLTTLSDIISVDVGVNVIGLSVSGGTPNLSNNKVGNLYNTANSANLCTGVSLTGGTATLGNNTIHDIFSNSTSTISFTQLGTGIIVGAGTHTVDKNTIYNIFNTNTGISAYLVAGISVTGSSANIISRNRIYNIRGSGTGTGTNANAVSGIYCSGNGNTFRNNQIAVGANATGESKIYGIQDASASGINNYFYNAVFVTGNTSGGANHSYALYRTSSGSKVVSWNNIFYNKRTSGGSGFNFATGSANSAGVTAATSNYNLYVVNDTAKVCELQTGAYYGAWGYNNAFYTLNGTYNTNWIESVSKLPADSLFIDNAGANLGININRTQSWYVNGKGYPIATESTDFNNTSAVRSILSINGSTDIGSEEFTPATGILPPAASADKVPTPNDSTTYFFGNRPVAKFNWGASGTLPSSVDVRYYSGVNPPATYTGSTHFNAYWDLLPTGGTGYNFTLNLLADSNVYADVVNMTNARMARYTGMNQVWTNYASTTIDRLRGMMSAGTLTDMGVYTGTHATVNPLPVKLLSFTGSPDKDGTELNWTITGEYNNAGFSVTRSVNGKTFNEIGFVKSPGNSNSLAHYTYSDKTAPWDLSEILFYRLVQKDRDGTESFSNIIAVSWNKEHQDKLAIYPNPFNADPYMQIMGEGPEEITISVADISGKECLALTGKLVKGTNNLLLEEMNSLKAGVYYVTINLKGGQQRIKMIKE